MNTSIQDLNWRYAVKKFDINRELEASQIAIIKDAFCLTATSYGLQPISLVVIKNKSLQRKLVKHSFDQSQIQEASHVLVLCIHTKIDEAYISEYYDLVKKVRGLTDEILNPFKEALNTNFENMAINEIQAWSKNQAYLALGNLLTVCAAEKIDACPMEGFDSKAYDEILELKKKGLSSVLVLPIGYRAGDDQFASFKKVRKSQEKSIIEISE